MGRSAPLFTTRPTLGTVAGWEADKGATAWIYELLHAKASLVPFKRESVDEEGNEFEEELHVFELKSKLQRDETSTSTTMVVPPDTRGAWKAVLNSFELGQSDQRFLVIGSPGIGKSRTINYFIRLIINEFQQKSQPLPTIVFEHRKDRRVWKFAPKDPADPSSEYEAFSMGITRFAAEEEKPLRSPDNVYIVDSGQAEGSVAPALLPATTIYVCSPDTRHFSEWEKHLQKGGTFFIPIWTYEAMEAGQPYMFPEIDVQKKMSVVGPIPRRMREYEKFKARIDEAMPENSDKIASVLLHGAGGVDAEHDRDKPLSAVFGFTVVPGSNYRQRVVSFVSNYARSRIDMSVLKSIYNAIISNVDPDRNVELGRTFELVVFKFLNAGWETDMKCINEEESELVKLKVTAGDGDVRLIDGGKGFKGRVYEMMKEMPFVGEGGAKAIFFGSNFPVIDAADAHDRGFSVTIAQKKAISRTTVSNLRRDLGLSEDQSLHVVFLVPEGYDPVLPTIIPGTKLYKADIPSPLTNQDVWGKALQKGGIGAQNRGFHTLSRRKVSYPPLVVSRSSFGPCASLIFPSRPFTNLARSFVNLLRRN